MHHKKYFSTTFKVLSHIGRKTIKYSNDVKVALDGSMLQVSSPKGQLALQIKSFVKPTIEEGKITIGIEDENSKEQKQMWGTTNRLIQNMVTGLDQGFSLPIRMVGVGYRAALENSKLVLRVGKSHPCEMDIPAGVNVLVPAAQRIILQGIDWPTITQFAAKIRDQRKPEPYNQKGIFVGDETIKKKEGKKR
jgi:large subunit ribosomal protein L6